MKPAPEATALLPGMTGELKTHAFLREISITIPSFRFLGRRSAPTRQGKHNNKTKFTVFVGTKHTAKPEYEVIHTSRCKVNTECEREDSAFMSVLAVARAPAFEHLEEFSTGTDHPILHIFSGFCTLARPKSSSEYFRPLSMRRPDP